MIDLLCCFVSGLKNETERGGATSGQNTVAMPVSMSNQVTVEFGEAATTRSAIGTGQSSVCNGRLGGSKSAFMSANNGRTVDVDTMLSLDGTYEPARWTDFGSRPELEVFMANPTFKPNGGSFSRPFLRPDIFHFESGVSMEGRSSGAFVAPVFPARCQPPAQLRCSTIHELLGAVSSTEWVGRGAQGVVLKAKWQSGCRVAVKWLVTNALNVPAAFMEALLAGGLAHPFLMQTFDCATCQLDHTFNQLTTAHSPHDAYNPDQRDAAQDLTDGSSCGPSLALQQLQLQSRELPMDFSSDLHADSFESSLEGRPRTRPADCLDVLRQLGAAPGKVVVQLVSEWCDEGTLHAAIRRGVFRPRARGAGVGSGGWSQTWALRALLRTALEVAQGMCHLHSLNIIHGDLKPGNVLLKSSRVDSRGFIAKVADFGLSRLLCSQREEFVATEDWGTVHYMAGEYLDNRLCKSSDVYSFGVLLWQMYTGRAPFADHLEAQVAVGVMLGNLQLEWPPHTPLMLLQLGQSCCRHEPGQRPTFKDVVVALVAIEAQVRQLVASMKGQHNLHASFSTPLAHLHHHQHQQQRMKGQGSASVVSLVPSQHAVLDPVIASDGGVSSSVIAAASTVAAASAVQVSYRHYVPLPCLSTGSSAAAASTATTAAATALSITADTLPPSSFLSGCGLLTSGNGNGNGGGVCSFFLFDSLPLPQLSYSQMQQQPQHQFYGSPHWDASAVGCGPAAVAIIPCTLSAAAHRSHWRNGTTAVTEAVAGGASAAVTAPGGVTVAVEGEVGLYCCHGAELLGRGSAAATKAPVLGNSFEAAVLATSAMEAPPACPVCRNSIRPVCVSGSPATAAAVNSACFTASVGAACHLHAPPSEEAASTVAAASIASAASCPTVGGSCSTAAVARWCASLPLPPADASVVRVHRLQLVDVPTLQSQVSKQCSPLAHPCTFATEVPGSCHQGSSSGGYCLAASASRMCRLSSGCASCSCSCCMLADNVRKAIRHEAAPALFLSQSFGLPTPLLQPSTRSWEVSAVSSPIPAPCSDSLTAASAAGSVEVTSVRLRLLHLHDPALGPYGLLDRCAVGTPAARLPLLRARSSRRASTGPMLQHVLEDEDGSESCGSGGGGQVSVKAGC